MCLQAACSAVAAAVGQDHPENVQGTKGPLHRAQCERRATAPACSHSRAPSKHLSQVPRTRGAKGYCCNCKVLHVQLLHVYLQRCQLRRLWQHLRRRHRLLLIVGKIAAPRSER